MEIEERDISVFAPEEDEPGKDSEVFFNEEMVRNRDLSEKAFEQFIQDSEIEDVRCCDPLAASGIRGFRYGRFVDKLFLNDSKPEAVESIKKGLAENSLKAEVTQKDANILLSENRNRFHLIDVDPFGPFTRFLDSTARASNHSSFVGFTATDVAVPAGSYRKTCMRRYGSRPLKNSFMHETALRIYIHEVFRNFSRYDKAFDPKLCFQERHYCRIMGRVTESKSRCNRSVDDVGYLSFCPECRWRKLETFDSCQNCGNENLETAGPLWTGKISDSRFTSSMLEDYPEEWKDSHKILELVDSEAEIIKPFYDLHELSSSLGISSPKRDEVLEKIHEIGYPVSRTHLSPTGFRTTMPIDQLRGLIKEFG